MSVSSENKATTVELIPESSVGQPEQPTQPTQPMRPSQTLEGIRDFFPFLYKLYMLTNRPTHEFIHWSSCGTMLQFDYITVQDYLLSSSSIFCELSITDFMEQLRNYKFERIDFVEDSPEYFQDGIWLQYRHEYFQRQRSDLLKKIKGKHYKLVYMDPMKQDNDNGGDNGNGKGDDINIDDDGDHAHVKPQPPPPSPTTETFDDEVIGDESAEHVYRQRARGDDCVKLKGHLSALQLARLRVDMVLGFHEECQKLRAKTDPTEFSTMPHHMQMRRNRTKLVQDPVIELPADKFENPVDSMMQLAEGFNPGYAGYFGGAKSDLVYDFFGEYTPRYNASKSEIITDVKIRDSPVLTQEQTDSFMDDDDVGYEYSLDEASTKDQQENVIDQDVEIVETADGSQMDVDDYEQVITSLVEDPDTTEATSTPTLYQMTADNQLVAITEGDCKKLNTTEEFPDEVFDIYMEQVSCDEDGKDATVTDAAELQQLQELPGETVVVSEICDDANVD